MPFKMIEEVEVLEAGMAVRIDAIETRMGRLEESVSFVSEFRQLLRAEMAKHLGHVPTEISVLVGTCFR